MNRIISFSTERADLASCHLKVDQLSPQLRPLPGLFTDHLSQGVYLWCLFPEWKHTSLQHLNDLGAVAEGHETSSSLSPEDDEEDIMELVGHASERLRLTSDSSVEGKKELLEDLHQYSEMDHGPGKAAFEKYLEVALTDVGYQL